MAEDYKKKKLVFISHRTEDQLYSLLIGYFLESHGIKCFDFIVDQAQNVGKNHVDIECETLDKDAFACLILISKRSLNPKTSGQIESEFASAFHLAKARPEQFWLIPIFTDITHRRAMKIKKSWVRKNRNYQNFFDHHVGLEAPADISKLTCFEEFEHYKQGLAKAKDDPGIRNSFWGDLLRKVAVFQAIDEKISDIPDSERLRDFEQKIREYISSISLLKKWFWFILSKIRGVFTEKRALCPLPGKTWLLICAIALALTLALFLWFLIPQKVVPKTVPIKPVPPFNTIQSFNEDTNLLTLSCEERNCYLSVLLPSKGPYQLGLKVPPECAGGIRLGAGKTTLNLLGAKRHGDVPDYFLLETGLFKIDPPIGAAPLMLHFCQLGNARIEISFHKIQ